MEKDVNSAKKAFVRGANYLLDQMEWGSRARVARAIGITPSFMSDIMTGKKFGTQETRTKIAYALQKSYNDIVNIGYRLEEGKDAQLITAPCTKYQQFSEGRASCLYRLAAKACGLEGSWFFSEESIKRLRPPGWLEYLNAGMSDLELYHRGVKEMTRLKKIVLEQVEELAKGL